MVIGLTGGFGCGKSTALGIFDENGARIIDCDSIVRDLLENCVEVGEEVKIHFGDDVFNDKGKVDRKSIAAIVFEDSAERLWLEHLLHPLVGKHWRSRIEEAPQAFWVVEIPLLFEKKLEKLFDFTVCISSSQSNQLARLKRRGLTADQVNARISHQLPLTEKIQRADFVISNNGSVEFLSKQIVTLISDLGST